MANVVVEANERESRGKNACRRLRAQGRIPGVIYGRGMEPIALDVDPKEILGILYSDSGHNTIFKLKVRGKSENVIIRDYQLDPVRDQLLHTDFQTISMDRKMHFDIPIEYTGTAEGVQQGGIPELITREVSVECLPADLPDNISIDISELEIGDNLHVSDLEFDRSKIQMITEEERLLITVVAPSVAAEEEVEEEVVEVEGEEAEKPGEEPEEG